ncbi:MAG: 3-mercaptopyruvate sulfurtransferase [Pseudomonadota bacterium]
MTDSKDQFPYPLTTTDWLAAELGAEDLKIIDASWRMPGNPPAIEDHLQRRIPGAVFFDLDAIADKSTGLPHMLASEADFAAKIGALGVSEKDHIVVYDDAGLFSAARVWWNFRTMGHDAVAVLDGGLPKWLREERAVETGRAAPAPARYSVRSTRPMVKSASDVREALSKNSSVVLDARPAARFSGETKEPRPGLRSGHMPGAVNLPHSMLMGDTGELKSLQELATLFHARGVHAQTPVITTCGSGVTASVLALALERLGHRAHAVYDGSWTEWGDQANDPELFPVVAG